MGANGNGIELLDAPGVEWDEFVHKAYDGTFCHLRDWQAVIGDVLGHQCLHAVARAESGEIAGLLPLVRVRSLLLGDYLVSMPFLSYGGPIGGPAAQTALSSWAARLARQSGVDLLELRTRHRIKSELRLSNRKITVLLQLPDRKDELDRILPSSRRRQIRRALDEGMELRFGSDQVGAFYEVFARNMRDLGTPVLPHFFFEMVCRVLSQYVRLAVVYRRGVPVSAGLGFAWRDEFELTWVSSLYEYRAKYPNMLLYRSFMELAIDEGNSCFNFGRCTPGGSTHKFKRQWGGEDVSLPWLQVSARGRESPPSPEKRLYQVATQIWRRLPLRFTNRLGPLLSPYLP